jgi:Xaa-Pro aminopeptidase
MADSQAFARRVERFRALMEERGYDAAIVRDNAGLRWLTGAEKVFDFENAHTAFITSDGLWFHTDSRYYNTFIERLGADGPWAFDQEMVSGSAWAAAKIAASRARVVAIEDSMDLAFYDDLLVECAKKSIAPLFPRMHADIAKLRIVKDEEELELLREAQRITDEAFEHMCGFIKVGMTEKEIRVELENYMLTHGADGLSFDSIIAAGPNGANPHAQPSDYRVQKGDFIVMDYGALYRDYHADMTRTVILGQPTEEQQHVYDIVRLAHETCAATAKPGCIGKDIHNLAVKIISENGYGEYFGHGLGHGVGLEIHEKPVFGRTYEGEVPVGSVITVEPGIYLPGRFGIRLEDTGVMTEEGYAPFANSPHELVVIDCD